MSHSPLRAEIDRALKGLSSEDSARINPDTAEKVFETLLAKLPRVGAESVAIKNSLAKRCIGTQGEKRQPPYGQGEEKRRALTFVRTSPKFGRLAPADGEPRWDWLMFRTIANKIAELLTPDSNLAQLPG